MIGQNAWVLLRAGLSAFAGCPRDGHDEEPIIKTETETETETKNLGK